MARISESLVERAAGLVSGTLGAGVAGAGAAVKSFSEKSRGGLESWANRDEARRSSSAAFIFTSGAKALFFMCRDGPEGLLHPAAKAAFHLAIFPTPKGL